MKTYKEVEKTVDRLVEKKIGSKETRRERPKGRLVSGDEEPSRVHVPLSLRKVREPLGRKKTDVSSDALFAMAQIIDRAPDLNVERDELSGIVHGCLFQQQEKERPARSRIAMIYTEKEAADLMMLPLEKFRSLVQSGKIADIGTSRAPRFLRANLETYLIFHCVRNPVTRIRVLDGYAPDTEKKLAHAVAIFKRILKMITPKFGMQAADLNTVRTCIRDTLAVIDDTHEEQT